MTARDLTGLVRNDQVIVQAGAIAWRSEEKGRWELLLVTSRRTGRWILPKGNIDAGSAARCTVAQELREEAGVVGDVAMVPFATVESVKIRPPNYWPVSISFYPVRIRDVLDTWPERHQRERRFCAAHEAVVLVNEPDVSEMISRFAATRVAPQR